jgi:uncharacterized membrane protein YfcA
VEATYLPVLAVLVPTAVIGGFLRGFAGFGGPLFMLPIFNVFFPPTMSIAIIMWVDLFSNIQILPDVLRNSSAAVVFPLTIGTLLGMPIGVYVLLTADPLLMKRVISGAILVAALTLLSGWRYPRRLGPKTFGAVGILSGSVMGATAIAVVTPLFLAASSHTASENRANFIVWVFFATILLIAILAWNGTLALGDIWIIVALIPAYLIGIAFGNRAQRRASELTVRRAVLVLVVAVAFVGLVL